MKVVKVGGMGESGYGLRTLELMKAEGLGDYVVLFVGPWPMEALRQVAAFCKENHFRFVMDEMVNRLTGELTPGYAGMDKKELGALVKAAGESFDGSLLMCEYGGLMLYWPQAVVAGSVNTIPPTADFAQAEAFMVGRLKEIIAHAKASGVPPPYVCIEASGGVAKQLHKAGIDRVDLEVTYNPHTELFYSAVKGAAAAVGKDCFGTDMAMVWYGGNQHDQLWRNRWRVSLLHAFIRGADPIYAEHGIMDYKALGKRLGTEAGEVKQFRRELAGLAALAERHPRPSGFPLARIAVLHGNLDSFSGLGQTHVWGQRGDDRFKNGPAEASWSLFNTFYERSPWEFRYQTGDHDCSGNPPLGQVDVIPADSPLELMRRYDCLLFLGWNSMTPELYRQLRDYVEGGGHLWCALAHLNTATSREAPFALVNGGDLEDLFGVKATLPDSPVAINGVKFKESSFSARYPFPLWSAACDPKYMDGGFPAARLELGTAEAVAMGAENFNDTWEGLKDVAIAGNRCGAGSAFLVNSLEYPGLPGLRGLYRDLLRMLGMAWQKGLQVECGDRVRHAVYEEGDMLVLYLLNTEPHLRQEALVSFGAHHDIHVPLEPAQLRAVYCRDEVVAIPDDVGDRITSLGVVDGQPQFQTFRPKSGEILCHLTTDHRRHEHGQR